MNGGILFLTNNDFKLQKNNNQPNLCTTIPGFSLLYFYSTQCVYCQTLIPLYKKLPSMVQGCQFGMINISNNKQLVYRSQSTTTVLKYVPYIVLYVHGKPFMRYDGPHKLNEIRRFILEVHNDLKHKQSFSNKKEMKTARLPSKKTQEIPAYTIGKPLCGSDKDVCYLDFVKAYQKK